MEQTTAEVVKGAELANSAGTALEEIETVSTNLAELIQDISEAAKHQATTSSHISNTMNIIQEITSQTLSGTNDTATSIGDLAEMAIEMRESVSGFILPDTNQPIIPEESEGIEAYQESYDETDEDSYDESSHDNDEQNGASGIDATPEKIAEFSLVDEEDHEIEEGHEFDSEAADFNVNGVDKTDPKSDKKRLGESEFDEDENPFHLEQFEAEIEALLSDNDKKQ